MGLPGRPPGHPGMAPRWTSSAKSGVGTSLSRESPVWFTLSHGIVNEVYYPRPDQANLRDAGFIVTEGDRFFSEEKRHAVSTITTVAPGVPAYRVVSTCDQHRYRLHKTIFTDPARASLLQHVRFEPLEGDAGGYRLFALVAPHLANCGLGNDAWLGDYKGCPMLFAEREGTALAVACSSPWRTASCGYVGVSDGWQDLQAHGRLAWRFEEARDGNVALTGEIELAASRECVVIIAFGRDAEEAGQRARASLQARWTDVLEAFVTEWQAFQRSCADMPGAPAHAPDHYRVSTAVLRTHEAKNFPGGVVASLSIPWGFEKSDDDLGGYHLVWPRDQVEAAGALLACGDEAGARRVFRYLMATQEADGHWPQNMWLQGTPYWNGIQLDETAFPILLADALRRANALAEIEPWATIRRAAAYLVCHGPVTPQDRWEEDGGYSPFTLAVVVAALLAAADFADAAAEPVVAADLRDVADGWNDQIERWTYVTGTTLARRVGVDGYYVRIAPPDVADAASPAAGYVPIKNRPPGSGGPLMSELVSPDALALVRFGLRAADDPRIVSTVEVVDALLKTEVASGPVWHRYNEDGYGEHEDGRPFDGTGVGRGWPLLTGERAHYELSAGRRDEADRLRTVMEAQAGESGLFPEQVWDAADVPARELRNGRPSGSAMPLVWTHAEYVKLRRSLRDGRIFDAPPQTTERYLAQRRTPAFVPWRFSQKRREMPAGRTLRVETLKPARIRWSADAWTTFEDIETRDTGLGLHVADLATATLPPDREVVFTCFWRLTAQWAGEDFRVTVIQT